MLPCGRGGAAVGQSGGSAGVAASRRPPHLGNPPGHAADQDPLVEPDVPRLGPEQLGRLALDAVVERELEGRLGGDLEAVGPVAPEVGRHRPLRRHLPHPLRQRHAPGRLVHLEQHPQPVDRGRQRPGHHPRRRPRRQQLRRPPPVRPQPRPRRRAGAEPRRAPHRRWVRAEGPALRGEGRPAPRALGSLGPRRGLPAARGRALFLAGFGGLGGWSSRRTCRSNVRERNVTARLRADLRNLRRWFMDGVVF